jgi:hypothetical protein
VAPLADEERLARAVGDVAEAQPAVAEEHAIARPGASPISPVPYTPM